MIATGDPRIKEKIDLDIQVAKLKMLKSHHMSQKYEMEDMIIHHYPKRMAETQLFIDGFSADLPILESHPVKEDAFSMTILGKTCTERKEAGMALAKVGAGNASKGIGDSERGSFPQETVRLMHHLRRTTRNRRGRIPKRLLRRVRNLPSGRQDAPITRPLRCLPTRTKANEERRRCEKE